MKKLFTLLLVTLAVTGSFAQRQQAVALPVCGALPSPTITGHTVSFTSGTTADVTITWTGSGADTYSLSYAPLGKAYTQICGGASTFSCTVHNLNLEWDYTFQVRAFRYCKMKNGEPDSEEKTAEVAFRLPPPAPTGLTATNVSDVSFTASWNYVSSVAFYYIDVSTSPNFDTFVMNNVKVTTNSAQVNSLSAANTYYYRVRAVSSSGISPNSATYTVYPRPSAPQFVAAAPIFPGSQFMIVWGASQRVTTYQVEVATNPSYANAAVYYPSGSATNLIVPATPDALYYLRIKAWNGVGSSGYTAATYTQPPVAPVILPCTDITLNGFTVNWQRIVGLEYTVDVAVDEAFSSVIYMNLNAEGNASLPITGLLPGIDTYYVRVRASNGSAFRSDYSATQAVTLASLEAPTGLAVTDVTTTGFTVNWQASAGAALYWVDVCNNSDFNGLVYTNTNAGNSTSLILKDTLPDFERYYIRVRAFGDSPASKSAYSSTVSTQLLPVPPVFLNIIATAPTEFSLNWFPGAKDTDYFLLDFSTDQDFNTFIYNSLSLPSTTPTITFPNLSPASPYYVRIRAGNSLGISTNSETLTVVTPSAFNAASQTESKLITVYPNPTTGKFSINLDLPDQEELSEVRVLSATGETLSIIKYEPGTPAEAVDLSSQPLGIYSVQLTYKGQIIIRRIIKL